MIHNLSVSMQSLGYEPYILAPHVRGKNNELRVPYKVLRYQRPSSKRFGIWQLIAPVLWYYRKYRFDILHCHGVYPPGYVGALFHKFTGTPFLVTPHGGDIEENNQGHIINQRITARIKKTFSSAHAVTAISSSMGKRLLRLGVPPERIHFIPNGIFVDKFRPDGNYQVKTDTPYIFFLGSLIERKGIDILIKAFKVISGNHPNLRLKIAGEGKDKDRLLSLCATLDLSQNVDFIGLVRDHEKVKLLQNALFLVCPSRAEPFGIVNIEALASGIPVIANNVGGIPDIIKDGENGLLVDPENHQDLAGKMDMLLTDSNIRKRLLKNVETSVLQYDWSLIAQKYLKIYNHLQCCKAVE